MFKPLAAVLLLHTLAIAAQAEQNGPPEYDQECVVLILSDFGEALLSVRLGEAGFDNAEETRLAKTYSQSVSECYFAESETVASNTRDLLALCVEYVWAEIEESESQDAI